MAVLLLLAAGVTTMAATPEVPAKVKVIAQSSIQSGIYITVIDLSNNEIVILCYGASLRSYANLLTVTRTGMFVDPNTQNPVNDQDAPIEPNKK